jgi:hypothetical protein
MVTPMKMNMEELAKFATLLFDMWLFVAMLVVECGALSRAS